MLNKCKYWSENYVIETYIENMEIHSMYDVVELESTNSN